MRGTERRWTGRRRGGAAALAVLVVAGCAETFFSGSIGDRRSFAPPVVYLDWWEATEACSGRNGDFARIDWYLASWIEGDGVNAWGRWSPPHEIILVDGWEANEDVVRHEMLHDLLGGDREHGNPAWEACDLQVT